MNTRKVAILGTAKYLPQDCISSDEMDERLGVRSGWVLKKTDIKQRYFATNETSSQMGAKAAAAALQSAGLTIEDIDCLVCTSGTFEQPIPSTATLIQREMGHGLSGIPSFDINSTCLSFVTGLDVISYMIAAGKYKKVLLVSTEIASKGLNWEHKESAALFGDGAAAVIVGRSEPGSRSQIISSLMETYGDGAHLSEIRGGGTRIPPSAFNEQTEKDFLFDMDGPGIYRMASRYLPAFVNRLLKSANTEMKDIRLVIPHQGSAMAVRLLSRKLGISKEQLMYNTVDHGNTVAASIPMGLHEAIKQKRIERGDRVLLLGTSAGLSLGGIVLDY